MNVYKNFGTAQFTWNDELVEFVGARKESYDRNSRKPHVEDGTLEDDLSRRDFTINALAVALNGPEKGQIIDRFNGVEDLNNKLIRTPLDPDITFSDDPLRMLRAIRFASQLRFNIVPETYEAIVRNAYRLEIISKERIAEEMNKILLSPQPSIGIKLLEESGLLKLFLPELVDLKGIEKRGDHGHKDNFLHTLEVVDKVAMVSNNLGGVAARHRQAPHQTVRPEGGLDLPRTRVHRLEDGAGDLQSHEAPLQRKDEVRPEIGGTAFASASTCG